MKMDFDTSKQIEYAGERVIERGCKIHDEWIEKGYSSRKIVKITECMVASMQAKKTNAACVDALSCLFALDMRIKEKYKTLLRCVFSYFSWRRETRAFKLLEEELKLSDSNGDIRTAIEVELQRLRERIEGEDSDDEDDTVRGGKRNGKSEEETVAGEEKAQDQAAYEKNEDISDIEEQKDFAEEKTEKNFDPIQSDEQREEAKAQQNAEEAPSEDTQIMAQKDKEQAKEAKEIKEENNLSDENPEQNADKSKETKIYNGTIDPPPLYEQFLDDKSQRDTGSFVDEVIIDDMIKGKEDAVRYNPSEDANQVRDVNSAENAVTQNLEENKSADKNAYLYDRMVMSDKGGARLVEKIAEMKSIQVGASAQNSNSAEKVQGAEDLRVPLQVDITIDQENEMRRAISSSMSAEAIQAIYESQASAMREQLTIASAELGMDAPVEIIGKQEPTIEQPSAVHNRK